MLKSGVKAEVSKVEMAKTSFEFTRVNDGHIYLQSGCVIVGYKDSRGRYHGYMVSAKELVKAIDAVAHHQAQGATAYPQGEATGDCLQPAT